MRTLTMLLALLVVVASCTGTAADPEVPSAEVTTTVEVVEAFEYGEDDLCEWITEDDVTRFVREAHTAIDAERGGEAVLSAADWGEDGNEYECHWSLGDGGAVIAEFWPVPEYEQVVDHADLAEEVNSLQVEPVVGHPNLPTGVLVAGGAYGRYVFWLPGMSDGLVLSVWLDQTDEDTHTTASFVVADGFLREMGWFEQPAG